MEEILAQMTAEQVSQAVDEANKPTLVAIIIKAGERLQQQSKLRTMNQNQTNSKDDATGSKNLCQFEGGTLHDYNECQTARLGVPDVPVDQGCGARAFACFTICYQNQDTVTTREVKVG